MEILITLVVGAALGGLASWLVAERYHRRQRAESAPLVVTVEKIWKKVEGGTLTKDEAARELILALERGSLAPKDLVAGVLDYKSCPECGREVEIVNSWEASDDTMTTVLGGGHTVRCTNKACGWSKEISY